MSFRLLVFALIAVALAACVTASPHRFTAQDVQTFRLTKVDMVVSPNAISWEGEAQKYVTPVSLTDNSTSRVTLEQARDHVRGVAVARIEQVLVSRLAPVLSGSRPVRAVVTVKSLDMPSAIRRVLIAGDNRLAADVVLVDEKTNLELIAYRDQSVFVHKPGGIGGLVVSTAVDSAMNVDPLEQVVSGFATSYVNWLLKS